MPTPLKNHLIKVLRASTKISDQEKSFLIETIPLFNDDDIRRLIEVNQ